MSALSKKLSDFSPNELFCALIKKTTYRNVNIGTKQQVLNIITQLSNKKIENSAIKIFNLRTLDRKKLNIALASKLPFHELGKIKSLLATAEFRRKKIKTVFSDMFLFLLCNALKGYKVKIHIYKTLQKILVKKINNQSKKRAKPASKKISSGREIAIFYHLSKEYGQKLYSKNHLIINDRNSILARKNVDEIFLPQHKFKIYTKWKLLNSLKSIKFFIFCIIHVKKLSEFLGVFILTKIFYNFLIWKKILEKTNFKKIIFDYDILVPKELCLACELLSITTVALQERPQMSLNNFYGVIFDHYFYAGKIYAQYGRQNYFHDVKNSHISEMWRLQYFRKLSKRTIRIKFSNKETNCPKKGYILFLGYFLDETNPVTTQLACIDFVKQASDILKDFPKLLGILRFKECGKDLTKVIMPFLIKNRSLALCDDYRFDGLSYQLCKHSALIISLPTSLADEALQFGKNVLFFDKLTPFYDIATTCIPKEYHHLIINEKNKKLKIHALLKKTNKTFTTIKNKQTCCAKNIAKVLVNKN